MDWLKIYNDNIERHEKPLTRKEFVGYLEDSFKNRAKIMKLRWGALQMICDDLDFAYDVYLEGWDYNENTQKARQILTHMCLTPKGAFKAEDWL